MTNDPLPPDLLALERALAERPRPGPPAELRSRILAAVDRERAEPRPTAACGGWGRFAAATAAAALLAINLSASVAYDTDWRLRPTGPDPAELADRIRKLAPDTPAPEVRRQVLLLRAAAGLTAVPAPAATRAIENRGFDRWDMP